MRPAVTNLEEHNWLIGHIFLHCPLNLCHESCRKYPIRILIIRKLRPSKTWLNAGCKLFYSHIVVCNEMKCYQLAVDDWRLLILAQ